MSDIFGTPLAVALAVAEPQLSGDGPRFHRHEVDPLAWSGAGAVDVAAMVDGIRMMRFR